MATKQPTSNVRAFGDTSGASVDTTGMGGNNFVAASKLVGQRIHVLNWTFAESIYGPRCYVNARVISAAGEGDEITIPLSDKSPAYHQIHEMNEAGDIAEFIGVLSPNGRSFEWR